MRTWGVGGFFDDVAFKLRLLAPVLSEGSVSAGLTNLTSICAFCDVYRDALREDVVSVLMYVEARLQEFLDDGVVGYSD
jgi:hypothetical protein